MGHKPQDIGGKHYDHADLEEIRAAVDVYGAWIEKAYRGTKSPKRDSYVTHEEKTTGQSSFDLPQVCDGVKIIQKAPVAQVDRATDF